MDAVSYPNKKVAEFIKKEFVPLRVRFDEMPVSADFNVKWTPTIVVLDWYGKEHHRTVGFLPPEEFIPSLMLGVAKIHFDRDELKEAKEYLDLILKDFQESNSAPEAMYLRGVTGYKSSHDAKELKDAYDHLHERYPQSEWARRASPYSLL